MIGTAAQRRNALSRAYPTWETLTLYQRLVKTADTCPEDPLIDLEERVYSYGEAVNEIERIAFGLSAIGVAQGSHVALIMDNCAEFVFLTFALARLGAVKIPLNTKLKTEEWHYILSQSDAQVLVAIPSSKQCTEKVFQLFRRLSARNDDDLPKLKKLLLKSNAAEADGLECISWDDFLPEKDALPALSAPVENAQLPSDLIYTSGCTGKPKGVLLTHDMLWRSAYANCLNRGFEFGRRIFIPLPLFHVYGYVEGLLAAVLVKGTIVLTQKKCTAEHMLQRLTQSRANDILCVPLQVMDILKLVKQGAGVLPSSLHALYCSASTCPRWIWSAIRNELGISDVVTGYGMTEVSGASIQTVPDDATEILERSVGRILPGGCSGDPALNGAQLEYRIVDPETGSDCPAGTPGELWCRGYTVTRGYYRDPVGNRVLLDEAGWFHTGDVGTFDQAGYLSLVGRNNDLYKVNGENVSPKLIEDVITECSQVAYVEVVGVPDVLLGEVGAAFIELKEGGKTEQVVAYCVEHLERFQQPKHFFFSARDKWPQTATGKIKKKELRTLANSILCGDAPERQEAVVYAAL